MDPDVPGRVLHAADEDLELRDGAVAAARPQLALHTAVADERLLELDVRGVAHQRGELAREPAERLALCVAVQPLRARVPDGDAKVRVRAHDRVRHGRHEPFQEGARRSISVAYFRHAYAGLPRSPI